ncbi:DUF429 domain-containing protein [Anaeromyxobacter oryzisoli]|uniref:DUF429 domain-containing protein n=1 Tax=Anaeromyxobacter oryzisoli TaxID=2925408 RepID=UPI001F5A06DA|nr:DUF429 domain-containing protein [Anaeromyxobacter sp. SG63]
MTAFQGTAFETINNDTGSLRTGDVRLEVGQAVRIEGETKTRIVTYIAGSPGRFHAYFKNQGAVPLGKVRWSVLDPQSPEGNGESTATAIHQTGEPVLPTVDVPAPPVKTMWLPNEGRVVGVDWSGAADAPRKVWVAEIVFGAGAPRLEAIRRPFSEGGAETVSAALGKYLSSETYDVAGLDFCFGLEQGHISSLRLPTGGPALLGQSLASCYRTPEEFREAVGAERKRVTDQERAAPFAPTNLRMYKQTYWGLRAMSGTTVAIPPWAFAGTRVVVEVLPAAVAKWLGCVTSYKGRGEEAKRQRRDLVAKIKASTGMSVNDADVTEIVDDKEGDACDAVLAALAAASAWASAFAGAPSVVCASGEGWIYSAIEKPRWRALESNPVPSPELAASHEAGHAIVFAACGVPIDWVEVRTSRVGNAVRHGWTEARENEWDRTAPHPPAVKALRRALGKVGGIAGELVAAVAEPQMLLKGAQNDLSQLGAALVIAGVLPPEARDTPQPLILAAAQHAYRVIARNRAVFDEVRRILAEKGRVTGDIVAVPPERRWTDAEDQALLKTLRTIAAGTEVR